MFVGYNCGGSTVDVALARCGYSSSEVRNMGVWVLYREEGSVIRRMHPASVLISAVSGAAPSTSTSSSWRVVRLRAVLPPQTPCPLPLVQAAFATLHSWPPLQLHRLVAHFLRVRFPGTAAVTPVCVLLCMYASICVRVCARADVYCACVCVCGCMFSCIYACAVVC